MEKFLDFILWAEDSAEPDPIVTRSIDDFKTKIDMEKERLESIGQEMSPKLSLLRSQKNSLQKYLELNVFGYNSSKYDLQILMTKIMQALENRKLIVPGKESMIKILKKGTAYFSLQFHNIHFKDLMAFTCPMSLDKYLKTWTSTENKLVNTYMRIINIYVNFST